MPHFDMASIKKFDKGYRAQIKKLGVRDSQVFPTRREAAEWAARRESEIIMNKNTPKGDRTSLRLVLRQYAEEVSPTKRGKDKEIIRLKAFERYELPLDLPISQVTAQHIADFRDDRLKTVQPSSVLRELNTLSSVFETARLEWGLISGNPCKDIRRPKAPRHRHRVLTWREIKAMLRRLDYPRKGGQVEIPKQSIAVCMMVALRTGMRAGELCSLTWENVHDQYVHLPTTKNGKARDVPLSRKAKSEIERMRGWNDKLVFGITAASLDALFRKYRESIRLSGFTWHDTRHTAATMISKKVDVLTLCKIFGWSDPRMAMIYYNPSAGSIADMLG